MRLLQISQHNAYLAQFTHILHAHRPRHALLCAKQIAQHRHGVVCRIFKQQRWAHLAQHAVTHRRHFKVRRDGFGHAAQFANRLQLLDEFTQIAIGCAHNAPPLPGKPCHEIAACGTSSKSSTRVTVKPVASSMDWGWW